MFHNVCQLATQKGYSDSNSGPKAVHSFAVVNLSPSQIVAKTGLQGRVGNLLINDLPGRGLGEGSEQITGRQVYRKHRGNGNINFCGFHWTRDKSVWRRIAKRLEEPSLRDFSQT